MTLDFDSLHLRTLNYVERPSVAVAIGLVLLFIIANVVSTIRQYRRLAHFKGPFQASLSKWWLIKRVGGGRAYLDFWEVNQRYGKPLCSRVMFSLLNAAAPGARPVWLAGWLVDFQGVWFQSYTAVLALVL